MFSISLKNVSVHYPVFLSSKDISIRNKVFDKVLGGYLSSNQNNKAKYIIALNNINLTINAGDRVGIRGLNGSGKSTLLKVFSGALEPTNGKVTTVGKVSSLIDFSMGLDGELTAIENIILRAGLKNMTKNETEIFIDHVINFSELEEFKDIQICQYSSGMRLRLAYSMAAYQSGDILIMDEMVFVGDKNFSEKIKKNFNEILNKKKILIIASHNDELLKNYCNRFIDLEKGNISKIS